MAHIVVVPVPVITCVMCYTLIVRGKWGDGKQTCRTSKVCFFAHYFTHSFFSVFYYAHTDTLRCSALSLSGYRLLFENTQKTLISKLPVIRHKWESSYVACRFNQPSLHSWCWTMPQLPHTTITNSDQGAILPAAGNTLPNPLPPQRRLTSATISTSSFGWPQT